MRAQESLRKSGWRIAAAVIALVAIGTAGCTVYWAPPPGTVYYPPAPALPASGVAVAAPDAQLQQLVAPIALYPDPLLAQMLPASTYPQEIQQCAAWLAANPGPTEAAIDAQPWEASVKAMAHYPTVIQYMNTNIAWTQSLGSAVTSNQAAVMEAIQDLRAEAQRLGNLTTTPQQVVVQQGATIAIEPADPSVIWVPTYDPAAVFVAVSPITFDVSFGAGIWLVDDFDWDGGFLFVGGWHDWHLDWRYGPHGWAHVGHFGYGGHAWGHDFHHGPAPRVSRYAGHSAFRGRSFRAVPYRAGGRSGRGGGGGGGGRR